MHFLYGEKWHHEIVSVLDVDDQLGRSLSDFTYPTGTLVAIGGEDRESFADRFIMTATLGPYS